MVAEAAKHGHGRHPDERSQGRGQRDGPTAVSERQGPERHQQHPQPCGELVVVVEQARRHHRHGQPTKSPPSGDGEKISGEMTRRGPEPVELAVADHAGRKQRPQMPDQLELERGRVARFEELPGDDDAEGGKRRERPPDIPGGMIEGDDERHQVDPQRQHPQQGHRRHVLAEPRRRRHEQHRRDRRKRHPEDAVTGFLACFHAVVATFFSTGQTPIGPPDAHGAGHAGRGEAGQSDRPGSSLGCPRQPRLDHRRIGKQGEERSRIGKGVEAVGREARVNEAEPPLKERAGGREHDERQPDRGREKEEDRADRIVTGARAPLVSRRDRQKAERQHETDTMDHHLPARRQPRGEPVRVGIARQQHPLEEQEAGGPDTGPAAIPGEDVFAHQRLTDEEEKGPGEDRQRERQHDQPLKEDKPAMAALPKGAYLTATPCWISRRYRCRMLARRRPR